MFIFVKRVLKTSVKVLDDKIIKYCNKNNIFGMLRITVENEVVYERNIGFSDLKAEIGFCHNSMFTLYSLSKPFCAIGLLKLKDKGLVDIDCHPSKYVPEAKGLDNRVTIRHLLHHVSGVPDFEQTAEFKEKYEPGYSKYVREHLKLITSFPFYFEPATAGKYTNINFILCALIIENVSGTVYSEYMKKEVFEPLGMKSAVVDNENLIIPDRVKGYDLSKEGLIEVEKSHNWLLGAGDIVATVDDVYCLNNAIKNQLLLTEETWKEVLTPSPINSMGMGCTVTCRYGKKIILHNGGHVGFRTYHLQIPEDDFDIIFLSNSGFGNARMDLTELILSHFYNDESKKTPNIEMDKGYI